MRREIETMKRGPRIALRKARRRLRRYYGMLEH